MRLNLGSFRTNKKVESQMLLEEYQNPVKRVKNKRTTVPFIFDFLFLIKYLINTFNSN